MRKFIFLIPLAFIFFTSCKKCETCYLIETVNDQVVETEIGEFCGDEIEEQEAKEYSSIDGTAHLECE